MSAVALRHPLLDALRVRHGFGVRGAPEPPDTRRPRQVHGSRVVRAEDLAQGERPQADAIVCAQRGTAIAVVTADCLPILMATRDGRAVAAVHAGWRGLAAGVVEAGALALGSSTGGADGEVAAQVAVIGPHIGRCCYEVDEPVLAALARRYGAALDAFLAPSRAGHAFLDLAGVARHALLGLGLEPGRVASLPGACTRCDPERFHSYRRDGASAGRLLHFIAVPAKASNRVDTQNSPA